MPIRPRVRRWLLAGCAALCVLGTGQAAQALTISLHTVPPTPGTLFVNDSIFLEVRASGLTAGDAPSITAFDLDLVFNDTLLDFVGFTFESLGMSTCTPATYTASCEAYVDLITSTGLITFAAASLLDPAVINANQPASGALATIEFLATGAGTASFAFSGVDVSGTIVGTTEGPLSATTSGLSVIVAVPEPGTAGLVLLGLSALGLVPRSPRA